MEPIISTRRNNRPAKAEAESNGHLLETVGKMRVRIGFSRASDGYGKRINISGTRDISKLISTNRAHFALEKHKLYIVPSMDGYWLPRATGWKATLTNKEIVDALMPFTGATYPVVMKLMELAGIPDFPMYYIDLDAPDEKIPADLGSGRVGSQMCFREA